MRYIYIVQVFASHCDWMLQYGTTTLAVFILFHLLVLNFYCSTQKKHNFKQNINIYTNIVKLQEIPLHCNNIKRSTLDL